VEENKASRMFLVVAVVFGIIATVMAFVFLNSIAGTDRGPQVEIVVAKRDINPNVSIDPDKDFTVERIPAKYKSFFQRTIGPGERPNYKGDKVNKRILVGQPVFYADFSGGGEIDWSDTPGAYTIKADPGIVIPGDYVKIFNSSGQILAGGKAFRVLAVAGVMKMSRPLLASDHVGGSGANARSITLQITEAQTSELLKSMGPVQDKNTLLIVPPPAETTSRPAS
jgi:Flp pilus assembly protein CpaB